MVQRIKHPSSRLDHPSSSLSLVVTNGLQIGNNPHNHRIVHQVITNSASVIGGVDHQEQRQRRSFFQLAGHDECFKLGLRPDTILKKSTGNEEKCLMELQCDFYLAQFVPKIYGRTIEQNGHTYLEMQDLLAGFKSAISVMDIKMGYRTYREDELYKAIRESQLRQDMYDKMVEVDENEPTDEERRLRAVTKPRYMVWRESISSTASLGFRIEGMRLKDGTVDKDFKTIKEEEQISRAFIRYTKSLNTRLKYLQRLYDLKKALLHSRFFPRHELIGSSLLFVHDDDNANIWLIDFAKTHSLPDNVRVNHRIKWELGNHEDGYLAGIENLIRLFESITIPSSAAAASLEVKNTASTTTTTTTTLPPITSTTIHLNK